MLSLRCRHSDDMSGEEEAGQPPWRVVAVRLFITNVFSKKKKKSKHKQASCSLSSFNIYCTAFQLRSSQKLLSSYLNHHSFHRQPESQRPKKKRRPTCEKLNECFLFTLKIQHTIRTLRHLFCVSNSKNAAAGVLVRVQNTQSCLWMLKLIFFYLFLNLYILHPPFLLIHPKPVSQDS